MSFKVGQGTIIKVGWVFTMAILIMVAYPTFKLILIRFLLQVSALPLLENYH